MPPSSGPVVLMCMWAGNMMRDANFLKEGIELLVFTSPVSLHSNNLGVKFSFNKISEVLENLKHFRSFLKKINPSKFAIVINKAYII